MENTSGMTVQCTKASGSKTRSMAKVSTFGQMEESMTVNGKIIICTAKVSTPGRMADSMMETTRMTESTALVFTLGMMASNMKAGGKMESSTVRASTEKMAEIGEVSGKMERESNGLMMLSGPTLTTKIETTSMFLQMMP